MVRVGFKLTAESELRHLPNVLRDIVFLHGPGAIAAGFPKTYKTDVYLFPRQLDEQVMTLHRPALGAGLTVFTQEQADYTGVKVERPTRTMSTACRNNSM